METQLDALFGLTSIRLSGLCLTAIDGLELCGNCTNLDLSDNNIIQIEGLEFLPDLEELNLSANNVTQVRGLSFHTHTLKHLDLSRNSISDVDVRQLPECLEYLDLRYNRIPDVAELEKRILARCHCLSQLYLSPQGLPPEKSTSREAADEYGVETAAFRASLLAKEGNVASIDLVPLAMLMKVEQFQGEIAGRNEESDRALESALQRSRKRREESEKQRLSRRREMENNRSDEINSLLSKLSAT